MLGPSLHTPLNLLAWIARLRRPASASARGRVFLMAGDTRAGGRERSSSTSRRPCRREHYLRRSLPAPRWPARLVPDRRPQIPRCLQILVYPDCLPFFSFFLVLFFFFFFLPRSCFIAGRGLHRVLCRHLVSLVLGTESFDLRDAVSFSRRTAKAMRKQNATHCVWCRRLAIAAFVSSRSEPRHAILRAAFMVHLQQTAVQGTRPEAYRAGIKRDSR